MNQEELHNKERIPYLNLLIKPTNDCNFNCEYCFDKETRDRLHGNKLSKDDILKLMNMANSYAKNVGWLWHGGELTLMGIDYFRQFQEEFSIRYATNFMQTFQSNGYLIHKNPEWLEFLRESGIYLGLSFDVIGQESRDGRDYIEDLMQSCCDSEMTSGAITVIHNGNIDKMLDIYKKAKELFGNEYSLAFNLAMQCKTPEYNLDIDLVKEHFPKFFEMWASDTSYGALSERYSLDLACSVFGMVEANVCHYTDCRETWLSIYSNGDIYPCDRELKRYRIGNIKEFNTFDEIFNCEPYEKFRNDVTVRLTAGCLGCKFDGICSCKCNSDHGCSTESECLADLNSDICERFKVLFKFMYSTLQNLQPDSNINRYLRDIVTKYQFVSQLEIEVFLKSKGLDVRMVLSDSEISHLEDTYQYDIFRIFNPVRAGYHQYGIVCESNLELLHKIYSKHEIEIQSQIERRDT